MVKSIFTILLVGIVSSPIMLSTAFVNLAKIDSFTTSTRTRSNMLHDTFSSVAYKDSQTDMSRRLPVIAGNWKLNPSTASEARNMLKLLASNFLNQDSISLNNVEVIVFPPFPFLEAAIQELQGTGIKIGAQNVGTKTKGAFTGEVAPSMLASLGCAYVMLGHSERRVLFEEGDKVINEKMKICLEEGKTGGMGVILCVGETEEEYENNLLKSVVDLQVKKGLTGIPVEDLDRVIIAYEPVWAIGTGKVATPGQAQNAHVVIRKTLVEMYGHDAAQSVRIQYGGSVTPDSVESLMAQPDVDGALVGGASLIPDSFSRIVHGAAAKSRNTNLRPQEYFANECVSTKNVLGESPIWSQRDQTLYWISAPEEEVWAWNLKDAPYRRLFGTTIGCVILKDGPPGSILVAGERAFLTTTMSSSMPDFGSGPTVVCERPEQNQTTRPNDGRVDRQGRFVFGMYNNYHRSGCSEGENNAGLYRLDANLQMEQILDYKYRVSNCICFPADGRTIYFCDTPTRKVYAFEYPEGNGPLTNRRLVWTMPPNLPGGPDGAQVDADGGLWIALSGAGRVVRVDPTTGEVTAVVHLPVKCPTSCTFGGPLLDELFITTRGPDGGGLYKVKIPGVKGLPEPNFNLSSEPFSPGLQQEYVPVGDPQNTKKGLTYPFNYET